MTGNPDLRGPLATIAGHGAVALAVLYVGLRAHWALGGQALQESVGVTERLLSDSLVPPWGLVGVALAIALLPVGLRRTHFRRALLIPAWIAVAALTARGVSGLLLLYPLRETVPPMSTPAVLALAAYSPVFLLWAALLCGVTVLSRPHS
ncbi:DUF3995 domain-containing protein [Allokutzneria albata]|uniref:DUF3995 domain-containing protein n=1 Tax=Allokutzneria albata TaxID=211114 RepID=A0A1G9VXI1_ALLAB|nr:DUF3995 domain-containing protein [Allokutzneria albata]SDM76920.1 Protein of unknown function [Allokutzneria albata]